MFLWMISREFFDLQEKRQMIALNRYMTGVLNVPFTLGFIGDSWMHRLSKEGPEGVRGILGAWYVKNYLKIGMIRDFSNFCQFQGSYTITTHFLPQLSRTFQGLSRVNFLLFKDQNFMKVDMFKEEMTRNYFDSWKAQFSRSFKYLLWILSTFKALIFNFQIQVLSRISSTCTNPDVSFCHHLASIVCRPSVVRPA